MEAHTKSIGYVTAQRKVSLQYFLVSSGKYCHKPETSTV